MAILVAHAQEDLILPVCVNNVSRLHLDRKQMIRVA